MVDNLGSGQWWVWLNLKQDSLRLHLFRGLRFVATY